MQPSTHTPWTLRLCFTLACAWILALPAHADSPDLQAVWRDLAAGGDAALEAYRPATGADTAERFSDLYFDTFEGRGMEEAIGLRDPHLKGRLEAGFSQVIGLASQGRPQPQVATAWAALRQALARAASAQSGPGGFWAVFLQAFLILIREGFEAMLVIAALATYLRRQGATDKLPVIYQGVGWALAASLVTAWALTSALEASGMAREALEGATLLIAAGVLFYVSYWLISKSEAARWQAWVRGRIDQALSRGSLFALGAAAFLAVYREGAETVLFYQALAGQAEGQGTALALGLATAGAALAGIYWIMRRATLRLPLGWFLGVTAGLLYYLALSFAGNGVAELQVAGWLPVTPLDGLPSVPWLGIHPTLETLSAQFALLLPLPLALIWWTRQRRRALPSGGAA